MQCLEASPAWDEMVVNEKFLQLDHKIDSKFGTVDHKLGEMDNKSIKTMLQRIAEK